MNGRRRFGAGGGLSAPLMGSSLSPPLAPSRLHTLQKIIEKEKMKPNAEKKNQIKDACRKAAKKRGAKKKRAYGARYVLLFRNDV